MMIHALQMDELEYALVPCVNVGMRRQRSVEYEMRREWLAQAMTSGTRVLVALEQVEAATIHYPGLGTVSTADLAVDGQVVAGLLEYSPIESAPHPLEGQHTAVIDCLRVIPPFAGRGIARQLLQHFLSETAHYRGRTVIAYEDEQPWDGLSYMPAAFFRRFGFRTVGRDGSRVLLYHGLPTGPPPRLLHSQPHIAPIAPGKITVDLFWSGQCPGSVWLWEQAKREIVAYPGTLLRAFETSRRETVERHGLSHGALVNGRLIRNGLVSWKEIAEVIAEALNSA